MNRTLHLLLGALIVISFASGLFHILQYQPATAFKTDFYPVNRTQKPQFESGFASSKSYTQTHAASLVELQDGRLRAFWFSGSREGAKDVQIRSAVFDPNSGNWSAESVVATREDTAKSVLRYISKLGNPVCGRAADGTLRLFYVTVSLGGWSGSSITMKTSTDEGQTWSPARRLITSPFLNVSTLVKGNPFHYNDGTMVLPVYHEVIGKFAEILRLDDAGNVIDKQRLTAGKDGALQPMVVVKNNREAQVLMRNSGVAHSDQVIAVKTEDGGKSWSKPRGIGLLNPNGAVAAAMLPDKRIIAVINNGLREGISKGRDSLELMISADDGKTWQLVYRLEDETSMRNKPPDEYLRLVGETAQQSDNKVTEQNVAAYAESTKNAMCNDDGCGFEFSYPYLIQSKNGTFHLVYTWNRSFIKYVGFTQAWIEQRFKK